MSFGGSFQTGPDSLYAGADLVRKNEQENLRMAELRRAEAERQAIANDPMFQQDVGSVRTPDFTGTGMTDMVQVQPQTVERPPLPQGIPGAPRVAGGATKARPVATEQPLPKPGEIGYGPQRLAQLRQQYEGLRAVAESEVETQSFDPMTGLPIGGPNYTPYRDERARLKKLIDEESAKVTGASSAIQRINQIDAAVAGRPANDPIRVALLAERNKLYNDNKQYWRQPNASEVKVDIKDPTAYFSALERDNKLPPGLLKAIMMTESGGQPGLTSPAGAQGYFQFMPATAKQYGVEVNNLESEAKGAAKLMSDLLKQYNGNLQMALAAYNWGSGNIAKQGIQNMPDETRNYIPKVMGFMQNPNAKVQVATAPNQQQTQTAPAGSPGAERAQPSTTQVQQIAQQVAAQPVPKFVQPEQIYNPAAYSRPLQAALMQREQTKRLAEIQMRVGNVYKSLQTQAALSTMDNQLYKLQGDQGVAEFLQSNGKDAGRMMSVFSYYTGNNTQLQPRNDGLYNVVINGKVASEGLSASKIVERVRLTMDEGFRKTQADVAGKIFESGLKREEEYAKQLAQQIREIAIESIKGRNELNVEKLKMMKYDVKPTGAGDGTVIVTPPFGSPYVFNPSGTTIEIDGVKVQSMAAKPITGMPSLAWANNG
jgi:soluble lytic murein transglycosylase-like protein